MQMADPESQAPVAWKRSCGQISSPHPQGRGREVRDPDEPLSSCSDGSAEGHPQLHADLRPEEPGRCGQPGIQRVRTIGGTETVHDDLVHSELDQGYACRSKSMQLQ